jgi:hypothetical protein
MGFIKDVKVSIIAGHAKRARDEGRSVFLARINVGVTDAGMSGPAGSFAEQIEAVEATGWRLEHMSFTPDAKGKPEGYFFFRAIH